MVDYKRVVGFGVAFGLISGCSDDGSSSASEGGSSSGSSGGTGSATMQVVTTGDPGSATATDGSGTQGSMSATDSQGTTLATVTDTSVTGSTGTGPGTDTGPSTESATGSTGTSGAVSETSSSTGGACDAELQCGPLCCAPGELCTEGQCQTDCGGPPPCGPQQDCCADGELCNQGQCVMPAGACAKAVCATLEDNECPDGFVCDEKLALCLPSQADVGCKYIPPAAMFEPVPNFTWGARAKVACVQASDCQTAEACDAGFCKATWPHLNVAADDMPLHKQSSAIAVVGDIDRDCVPEIVFNTYNTMIVTDGVLRAIRGDNGAKVWTVTDPAWRTDGTASPAIGDINGDGQAEIVIQGAGKYLLAFNNDGTGLWKSDLFNMASVSGAVAIANIDNDGYRV